MSPLASASPTLRIYDPDLPMLAAQAAIELDSLRRGKPIGLDTVSAVGNRLKSSVAISPSTGKRAVIDSSTFVIVGQALDTTVCSGRLKTTEQLINGTGEIGELMTQLKEDAGAEEVEKIRNFCVALSKYAAAYRQSLHDLEPTHSFRR